MNVVWTVLGVLVTWEKRGFRVSKWIYWLKEITKGYGNMKGFEAKTMAFCVGIAFGFLASLKRSNVGSYLNYPDSKIALTFAKLPF